MRKESQVSNKIGERDPTLTGTRWTPMKNEVAGKIGSVELRDYSIRKPLLKIGQKRNDNFVDTYSIF
jgi:hypothetical protein